MSCYTDNYAEEAARLRADLLALNLDHQIESYECQAGPDATVRARWLANCYYRAKFLLQMLARYGHGWRICWLDADTRVRRRPRLLETLDCEIGACVRKGELLGGTLYCQDSPAVREVLARWYELHDGRTKAERSQLDLQKVIADFVMAGRIRVQRLPIEYCFVRHLEQKEHPEANPVFEHVGYASERIYGQDRLAKSGR